MSEAFRHKHQARQSADWALDNDGSVMGLIGPGEQLLVPVVMPGEGGGGGISSDSALALPFALRQEPNKGWPVERPNHPGPLILIGWDDPPAWTGAQYDQWIRIPQVFAPIVQDFPAAPIGPAPDWVSRWAHRFEPEYVADARALAGKLLRLYMATAGTTAAMWTSSQSAGDQSMLARIIAPAPAHKSSNMVSLMLRMSDNTDSATRAGYALQIRSDNPRSIRLAKWVAGTYSQIGSSVNLPAEYGTPEAVVWMEFSVVGTALSGRVWRDGQARADGITISGVDTSVAAGYAGLGANANDYAVLCDYIALSYDGNPAPGPA